MKKLSKPESTAWAFSKQLIAEQRNPLEPGGVRNCQLPTSADLSTTTALGNCSRPASKTTSPTRTCSKFEAQAGQVSRPAVEGASLRLPTRHTRRNRSEHLGQVATAKAIPPMLSEIRQAWLAPELCRLTQAGAEV